MSNSRSTSHVFSHLKRSSHGDSISLSFFDLINTEASDFPSASQTKIVFSVIAYTQFGSQVKVTGNLKELGLWVPDFAVPLQTSPETYPLWTSKPVTLNTETIPQSFEYKYLIVNEKHTKWERFSENRTCQITERCSCWTSFKLNEEFDKYSCPELKLETSNIIVRGIQSLAGRSLFEVLEGLLAILNLETVENSLIQMISVVLKGLNQELQENLPILYKFIERALIKLKEPDMKIILNNVHISEVHLENPSESLVSKADIYERSSENYDEDIIKAFKLSDLRKSILAESKNLKNSVSLLLTDNNLEKKEIDLIEKIIENLDEKDSFWKIIMIGKWICEMLLYNFIRIKQVKMLIIQFEKLEKKENIEVLRDLLYEMTDLLLEEYMDIVKNCNHFDLEVISKYFKTDYQLVFYSIFLLASRYIIKTVPILNQYLLRTPYLCFSPGKSFGRIERYSSCYPSVQYKHILIINDPDLYIDLNENTVGIIVSNISHFFIPILITARNQKIPVALNYSLSNFTEDCSLTLTEDYCWLVKAT